MVDVLQETRGITKHISHMKDVNLTSFMKCMNV